MRRKYELGEYSRRMKNDKKQFVAQTKLSPVKSNNWKNVVKGWFIVLFFTLTICSKFDFLISRT